ncbi:MAG TPA: CHAT domain-containing protein [Kineosporiaceae bacterium]|nr:CHAT domain-containing protein [Kineosporiaceae bacterium]
MASAHGDLDAVINQLQQVAAQTATDDPQRPAILGTLAYQLSQRANTGSGSSPDRDQAIVLLSELVGPEQPWADDPQENQQRAGLGQLLAQQLLIRAIPAGLGPQSNSSDLRRVGLRFVDREVGQAIALISRLLDTPATAEFADRGMLLAMLSQALMMRGAHPVDADPDRVIRTLTQARDELPAGVPGRAEVVAQLGLLRSERALRNGVPPAELTAGIEELTEAEKVLSQGHPLRPAVLRELGLCAMRRFAWTRRPDDERLAVRALEDAVELMDSSDPVRAETLGALGPLLLQRAIGQTAAGTGSIGAADRAIATMREALQSPLPLRRSAEFQVYLGNALTYRFSVTKRDSDSSEAVSRYQAAAEAIPDPDDDLHLMALTALGSALADRYDARHDRQDIDLAIGYLADVDSALQRRPDALNLPFLPSRAYVRSLLAVATFQRVQLDEQAGRPQPELAGVISQLQGVSEDLPADDPMAARIRSELSVAKTMLAARSHDLSAVLREVQETVTLAEAVPQDHPDRATLLGRAGYTLVSASIQARDAGQIDRGIGMLEQALAVARVGDSARLRHLVALGDALLQRATSPARRSGDLDTAIDRLTEAWQDAQAHPGHPQAPLVARTLARAYLTRGTVADRSAGRRIGLDGLRAHARNVLLQNKTEHGLTLARAAREDVQLVTMRCLADGRADQAVAALETGRALVLRASAALGSIVTDLTAAGELALAAQWQAYTADGGDADLELRHRTLAALEGSTAVERLLSPPSIADVGRSLSAAGRDALVYLLPALDQSAEAGMVAETYPAGALVIWFDGTVVELDLPGLGSGVGGLIGQYQAAHGRAHPPLDLQPGLPVEDGGPDRAEDFTALWAALERLCDWAGRVAVGVVHSYLSEWITDREPRIVLAPIGVLGVVPWHAARLATETGPQFACRSMAISYAASARQLVEVVQRPRLSLGVGVTLVANPDGTLPFAQIAAVAIRDAFYPEATYLGRPKASAAGAGTAAEILRRLPWAGAAAGQAQDQAGSAILEFDCHAQNGSSPARSRLQLADGDLPVERILSETGNRAVGSPGGIALLSACVSDLAGDDFDEALSLSTAFLAAGAVSVIGSRWAVQDESTAVFMYMFHHFFDHGRRSPAAALRATQLWMLDPERSVPPTMPRALAQLAHRVELSHPQAWAAFAHHGW